LYKTPNSAKQQLISNVCKGKLAEQIIKKLYVRRGSKIVPKKIGSDFIALHNFPGTNIQYREYVEVKSGFSKQTKIQKKTMMNVISNGHNYTIYHISDSFLKKYLLNSEVF